MMLQMSEQFWEQQKMINKFFFWSQMINKLICQMMCLDASGAQIEQIVSYPMSDANTKGRGILSQILIPHNSQSHSSFVHSPCESLRPRTKALFSCKKFLDFGIVSVSFVCGKYCLIID